jgi:hypothetical protein
MDESMLGKLDNQLQSFMKNSLDRAMLSNFLDMAQRITINKGHQNSMPISVDGSGCGESTLMKDLHEGEFPDGGEPGEIEPIEASSILDVLSIILYRAEGTPAQPRQL